MKAIYIEWKDAEDCNEWEDINEIPNSLPLIKEVGWLIKENKECIIICRDYDDKNQKVAGRITIPKAWIKKRKIIKL